MNSTYNYRQLHESFMQNHNGTSIWENIMIITPGPVLVYFVCLIKFYLFPVHSPVTRNRTLLFIVEFICLIYFLILNFTLLSDYTYIHVTLLLIAYVLTLTYFKAVTKTSFNIPRKRIEPRPYFTCFRSIVSVMTCICILAVDFHIFPRRFAKTESFGFGLMDTGVGFYIVANGIVIKQNEMNNVFIKSLRSCIPIIFLGSIRYFSLEILGYQKHVSEYGVHWNFFFTLASVKLIAALLIYTFPRKVFLMALLTAFIHQVLLCYVTEEWIVGDSPRSNFISANKEGIGSLPGYISLYLFSVAIGKFLNISYVKLLDDTRHGLNTFIWAFVLLVLTLIFNLKFSVSRRLANITYITWMLTMSLYGLSLSIFTEVGLRLSFRIKNEDTKSMDLLMPSILNAVNYNSLFYFLLSNILTGIVNLIFQTFYTGKLLSLVILMLYQLCSCGIMYVLYLYNLKVKFW